MRLFLVGVCCLWPVLAWYQDDDDVAQGSRIAHAICSNCHLADGRGTLAPNDGVSSFPSIARQKGMTAAALTAFLSTSHPPMPDLMLTRAEIRQVGAYILSQRN